MTGQWAGSTRRRTLPPNWPGIRAAIIRRDQGRCQWHTDSGTCGKPATDVDHIRRGGGDHPSNLRSLCAPHHARKSSAEGNAARAERKAQRQRTPEAHPGWGPPQT